MDRKWNRQKEENLRGGRRTTTHVFKKRRRNGLKKGQLAVGGGWGTHTV
jgi:hypothetical protein